jgi:hypothetical protein
MSKRIANDIAKKRERTAGGACFSLKIGADKWFRIWPQGEERKAKV